MLQEMIMNCFVILEKKSSGIEVADEEDPQSPHRQQI
jgi:hypothetical protein